MADDKYKSAGNIRAKITRFDFENTAKSNLAIASQIGDVASVIEKKTDDQNRRFDKLLKVLEFLPKNALEQSKQQKVLFVEMAKTVAELEKAAKKSTSPVERFRLENEAKKLRREGRYLAPDHDPSKVRNAKELGYKVLGLDVQHARENGVLSAVGKTVFPTFHSIANKLSGKNAFDRQVSQEQMYPEATTKARIETLVARTKGRIKNTDEVGMPKGKERSGSGEGMGTAVLRKISDTVVEIRNYLIGKKGPRGADANFKDTPPKSMFSDEDKERADPKNWKTYNIRNKKGQFTGKKGRIWDKRSELTGRRLKAGEKDPEIPDTPPTAQAAVDNTTLTDEQKARAGSTFDSQEQKRNEGQLNTEPKYAESGIEKEEAPKVEGSMTGGEGGGGMIVVAILAAITEAMPIFAAIGAGIAAIGLTVKAIKLLGDHDWGGKEMAKSEAQNSEHQAQQRKHLEEEAAAKHVTVEQMLQDNAAKGSAGAKIALKDYEDHKTGSVNPADAIKSDTTQITPNTDKKTMTSDYLEKSPLPNAAPTIIAPVTNNVVNNKGGGSSGGGDAGMPSTRTVDRTFQRTEENRQSRKF